MGSSYEKDLMSKQRRVWFGTLWKPQLGFKNAEGMEYIGCPLYEQFNDLMLAYEQSHSGCKYAYAYHEKGHNMPDYDHSKCEHIHFCIVQDNPITGKALKKAFGENGVHLEFVKYSVEHCGRYLLHLTVSSIGKEKIPIDNCFWSGKENNQPIWFPLITSTTYDVFIPNNVLHYVFNENMHSFFSFMARFGSCVCHGAYCSAIRTALDIWSHHTIEANFVREVYNTLDREHKRKVVFNAIGIEFNISSKDLDNFDNLFTSVSDDTKIDYKVNMHWAEAFQKLYIWWRCSDAPMNSTLYSYATLYGCSQLLNLNNSRISLQNSIDSRSYFSEELESSIIMQDDSDLLAN